MANSKQKPYQGVATTVGKTAIIQLIKIVIGVLIILYGVEGNKMRL